ncbi:hypothetical protein [Litoribacillus peritrichatus]|uniref:Uncharacterized protein n=1 Tax=Litoribacillus peritrichatus TaxID=718191 RepID=A0ABP7MD41_9GAMM
MSEFEQWYIESVEGDEEIFGPGYCSCGEKGFHFDCQEKMRKDVEYAAYLKSLISEYHYTPISDQNDELLRAAEAKLLKGFEFDPRESGYSIDEVLENNQAYYFPIGWIGCSGHLVVKSNLEVIGFGSYIGPESHIWAYHQGISLEELGKYRRNCISIVSVENKEKTLKVIRRFVEPRKVLKEISPALEKLPVKIKGVDLYFAIADLLEAKYHGWFDYEIT